MSGVNKVIIIGHLGKDPEMRYLPDGTAVASMSLATSEQFKDRDGNKQERTEWHRISIFGRPAEVAGEYLRKGSQAYVEGRLQTRKWTDKDGQDRYTTEIICSRLQLLGSRNAGTDNPDAGRPRDGNADANAYRRASGASSQAQSQPSDEEFFEDDIPF